MSESSSSPSPLRAGPLAQFLWDLATQPSLQADYVANAQAVLAARGLDTPEVLAAIQGDTAQLNALLLAEDEALNAQFGPRPADTIIQLEGWPPAPPGP